MKDGIDRTAHLFVLAFRVYLSLFPSLRKDTKQAIRDVVSYCTEWLNEGTETLPTTSH